MSKVRKRITAWAAVHKKTRHVLRNLNNNYAIYTHRESAVADCPSEYGAVVRVAIRELPPARKRK